MCQTIIKTKSFSTGNRLFDNKSRFILKQTVYSCRVWSEKKVLKRDKTANLCSEMFLRRFFLSLFLLTNKILFRRNERMLFQQHYVNSLHTNTQKMTRKTHIQWMGMACSLEYNGKKCTIFGGYLSYMQIARFSLTVILKSKYFSLHN